MRVNDTVVILYTAVVRWLLGTIILNSQVVKCLHSIIHYDTEISPNR